MNAITSRTETEAFLHEKLQALLDDLGTAVNTAAKPAVNTRFPSKCCSD